MAAEINRGPRFFGCTPNLNPTPILVVLGKLLPKVKLYTKFEVASFSGCKNKSEVPFFWMLSYPRPPLVLVVQVVSC